ncbi:TPA: hypothetical protein ACQVJ5_003939 [Serratia marcescens]|uniref:hypothetical protein n=1 Tax=Serratia TaxID=613 RepID=UPI00254F6BB4|nr:MULTISPECIES: hypothetical protein [Serratia]MDK5934527.1 hypothetical protein [Serratia nevei]MEC5551112.1 hypothetical protein [Serratia nevei]MEC5627408.1 hypothetical protein [Serratia nevei]MEC5627466.1 hypothetical protein [Serratia nevei]MEC5686037.1 hypothetical protein [Serratia nevei]
MTRVLIIYENIPESTDLFIVDANESELADLKLCHGNYTNAVDNEEIEKALSRVDARLGSKDSAIAENTARCGIDPNDVAKWNFPAIERYDPIYIKDFGIDMIVVTGFVM